MANEYEINFRETLKSKRRSLNRKIVPKQTKWLYPIVQEIEYYKIYQNLLANPIMSEVKKTLNGNLDRWIQEKERNDELEIERIKNHDPLKTYIPEDRKDAFPDEIRDLNKRIRKITIKSLGDPDDPPEQSDMWKNLSIIADVVFEFNKKQWNKQTDKILGFDYQMQDFWWEDLKRTWMIQQIELIRGHSEEYIKLMSEGLNRGIRNGLSIEKIIEEVNKVNKKVFENRASLLAVDQIGRLNSQLTKRRSLSIGLKEYIWRTQDDKRVRGNPKGLYPNAWPSHWIIDDKICDWTNNNIYAEKSDVDFKAGKINWRKRKLRMPRAIPGEEVRCRCFGEPYWDLIIKSVDKEIKEEEKQAA